MILHTAITISFIFPLLLANPFNSTKPNPNKTKRTIADQVYNHGDAKAVYFYMETPQTAATSELQTSASSPALKNFYPGSAKPLALVSVQQPIQVFEQDNQKQVAEQQVLYEFQQTPTNAVSNVHVKQLFQPSIEITTPTPVIQGQASSQFPTSSIHPSTPIVTANQNFNRPAATFVAPVHHSTFTNHAPLSNNYNPFVSDVQQFQNTQVAPKEVPGKYIYLNGKIVYNPAHIIPQNRIPPNSIYHQGVYHNQQKLPLINYVQKVNPPVARPVPAHLNAVAPQVYRQAKIAAPGYLPPITNNRFQVPKRFEQIDKPSAPVQKEEAEEEEDEEDDEEAEDDDDEDEETDSTENRDEDGFYRPRSFPFEHDDYLEDDENHYFKPRRNKNKTGRYIEDEEDTKREASQYYSKFHRVPHQSRRYRNPTKFENAEKFGFYEGYSTDYKTAKDGKKNSKKPIGKYKKIKFSKTKGRKPKVETIEGRFSENIPIIHKQKLHKERWYVTENLDGAPRNNIKIIK